LKNQQSGKSVSKGMSARFTNACLMVFGCLLGVLILITSYIVRTKYYDIRNVMYDYAECNKAINDFRDSCSYLTNQARLYSVNKNVSYIDNYFFELNQLKRREAAVDIIEMTHWKDSADKGIIDAYHESVKLVQKELYSMRLVSEATDIDLTTLPIDIQSVNVFDEDAALDRDSKLKLASEILFDSEYITAADNISNYCNKASVSLLNRYLSEQTTANYSIAHYFRGQFFIIFILLAVIVSLYASLIHLVVIPLKRNCVNIEKGKKMIVKGCSEVRIISRVFNNLYDKNAVAASDLKHKAEHDPLTGLINRNGLADIKEALSSATEPIAYLIVDIDFFKTINDTYGHLVGDEVLIRIANLMSEQFRNSDYVARIGGDEFAVIMTKIGPNPVNIIQRKIENMNRCLQNVTEDLPKVSLSVGVAFSEAGFVPSLEENADNALYKVKKGGRCNCSFFNVENDQ